MQLALLVFGLLLGIAGCSAAWIDQQGYRPSPNVCRPDQVQVAEQLGCVRPASQVPTPSGWQQ
ncbi:hypothetical protein [Nocardia cyriacigeorgica]|uniref:hypothetical protein n=1 Tax=Nocardia cyriacigeorgica TaxID=135487 RepID=UPI003517F311